ncbi:pilus assembly protein [Duganella radicis]|uniref:Pilus assembly protein PilY n=1 Tax=Duganella radicis TaxID=551988 RepID=A0A6L6PJS8_9BURK|nr:PilC/PilY family type IV pilus protein [Duganella radicis]MTV39348.1 pilus assembly protein PilY [Duganella radicis]
MIAAGGVSAARLVAAGLVALSICAAAALRAEPPGLAIDSWPVAAVCRPGAPGSAARAGEASGLALLRPAASPASGSGGDLYQATMDMADWGGHFSRYRLPAAVGGASAVAWDAGALLTGTATSPPIPAPERRQIYTAIVQPDGALTTIPFQWPALSVAQQTLLDLEDHAGEQRLAYLRGDRSLEGIQFRRRGSILGDAVHSTPVHVAPPDRAATVYLGANDGMLHAFDASSGIELFAYVPDAVMAGLPRLTDPVYVHRAYVDGPASAGQASIDGGTRTILLSAMGGGAPGVFALDVTDPAHFADGLGALWEFTSRDDPLMGNVTTLPQIARVHTRRDVYRHFAIVASGINRGGPGALFLLALDKPRDQGWRLNGNYFRIRTPASDALSAPVLLNDSDGALRYAYAGDLQGNLWRFDFSGSAPWTKTLLFVARDAEGHRQPITQTPLLAYANLRGYMVMFGTGRLIERADRAATARQSYYAIIDSLQSPPDIITGRHQLTQRFLDGSDGRMAPGSKGWYIDFTQPGERSVNTGVLADGAVLFNTVLPGADVCSATRSRSYVLNVITGLPDEGSVTTASTHDAPITGLMLPDYVPTPMLLPQSVTRSGPDAIGRVRQEKTYAVVQAGSGGALTVSGSMTATRRTGRLSWREIVNWRELHEAAK